MIEKDEKDKKDVDEKIKEFTKEFHVHGMGCGNKIAEIAKFLHPDALLIVPLYRSCIVVEQSDEDQKEGDCDIHSYSDPHWLGGDIDIETLKSDRFHFVYKVRGDRQGPIITKMTKEGDLFES